MKIQNLLNRIIGVKEKQESSDFNILKNENGGTSMTIEEVKQVIQPFFVELKKDIIGYVDSNIQKLKDEKKKEMPAWGEKFNSVPMDTEKPAYEWQLFLDVTEKEISMLEEQGMLQKTETKPDPIDPEGTEGPGGEIVIYKKIANIPEEGFKEAVCADDEEDKKSEKDLLLSYGKSLKALEKKISIVEKVIVEKVLTKKEEKKQEKKEEKKESISEEELEDLLVKKLEKHLGIKEEESDDEIKKMKSQIDSLSDILVKLANKPSGGLSFESKKEREFCEEKNMFKNLFN